MCSMHPHLKSLLYEILQEDIGLLKEGEIKMSNIGTGRPSSEYCPPSSSNCEVGDRFMLKIPFAGRYIIWEFIFNSLSPEKPPDINFHDDGFINFINVDCLEKCVPSLIDWKFDDVTCLRNVLLEFLQLFKTYQIEQLKENNYCWVEYLSVLKTGLVNEKDIEVLVTNNGLVHFLIRFFPDLMDYNVPRPGESMCRISLYCKKSGENYRRLVPFRALQAIVHKAQNYDNN